jgi:Putative bacterial sensory transduction regulator
MKNRTCISFALAVFIVHGMTKSAMAAKPAAGYASNSSNMTAAFARINEPMAVDTTVQDGTAFRHEKNEYNFYLSSCAKDGGCKAFQARACYDMPNANLTKVNAWNRDRLYARAMIDSTGRLCMDMVHQMPNEKIDDASLAEILKLFLDIRASVPDFFNKP